MEKKTKKIIITGSLIGLAIIVSSALILKSRKKRKDLEKGLLSSTDLASMQFGNDLINWPLRYGSGYINKAERPYVRTVQMYLNKKINENNVYSLAILMDDGMFGTKTEKALNLIAGVKEVDMTLYNTFNSYLQSNPGMSQYSTNENY